MYLDDFVKSYQTFNLKKSLLLMYKKSLIDLHIHITLFDNGSIISLSLSRPTAWTRSRRASVSASAIAPAILNRILAQNLTRQGVLY